MSMRRIALEIGIMGDPGEEQDDRSVTETEGTPVFPPGTSRTHRRRLLKAMAGGSTVALAGCLGLIERTRDPEDPEPPADVDVDEPEDEDLAEFLVSIDAPDDPGVNQEFEIVGIVENVGEETGLQEINLAVNGEIVASEERMLTAGQQVEIETSMTSGHPGDAYEAVIASEDHEASQTIRVGAPDYTQITDHMFKDVAPKQLVKELAVQVAFSEDEILFRFEWEQPDPGGWLHDMIYYDGDAGEWRRLSDWDPWVLDPDYGLPDQHEGYYEDRLSWMWHDGTLRTDTGNKPFERFGGWMTVMEGVRTLPGEAPEEEIVDHPHFGEDGLGRNDMRKFIPHSRNGEWWEHDWEDVKSVAELEEMMEAGEFIDFPFWRAHRSNPIGYGTNHHLLDYRHGPRGEDEDGNVGNTFGSQDWDPETGPEYMFDPEIVDGGAIDRHDVVDEDGNPLETMPPQDAEEEYALIEGENMVEFDPDVAEWDGAMIPRRPLQEPAGSGGVWRADGTWENGRWVVEMRRDLETGYIDDMPIEPGQTYTFSPALHHGVSQRWHWVAYPLKLAMGPDAETDWWGEDTELGTSVIRAEPVDDDPEWDDIAQYTIPLMYPGMTDWTWLTSGEHPRQDDVRNADITIWEHHDENPEDFAQRMVELEERFAPRK